MDSAELVDPLVVAMSNDIADQRAKLAALEDKVGALMERMREEQKMAAALRKVLAHIDSQPHEPSLKGVLKNAGRRAREGAMSGDLPSSRRGRRHQRQDNGRPMSDRWATILALAYTAISDNEKNNDPR